MNRNLTARQAAVLAFIKDFAVERESPESDPRGIDVPVNAARQKARQCCAWHGERAEIARNRRARVDQRNWRDERTGGVKRIGHQRGDAEIGPGLEERRGGVEKALVGEAETAAQSRTSP